MLLTTTSFILATCLQTGAADQWSWSHNGTELRANANTPAARKRADVEIQPDPNGIVLPGRRVPFVIAEELPALPVPLPTESLTAETWVSIDTPTTWGGFIGAVQDNGDAEKGWVLGYDQTAFTFGLASKGRDDGDGKMTYLKADRPYEVGRWHHVVGTYDGQKMRLFMDGQLVGTSDEQHGPILYDQTAPLAIGGYLDRNEDQGLDGRINSVRIQSGAMKPAEVARTFKQSAHLNKMMPKVDTKIDWMVSPFLTCQRLMGSV